ncbi:TetR/AcrR family transcriptional regulator [Longirhabdus pacifica]|uniref:TetR/AcrR family transcriptional regulator n=1 Tax=Longirhabdus pacifica TaxID=2305227 RepID=UPI001008DE47|nr:TetR/AcrR family transcriptional regulator [Longirhabdus pacifica]
MQQKQRSQQTKLAIEIAAAKLFAAKGFNHVTIREIAKEAECSHTTIYLYYKDKEQLLLHISKQPLNKLKTDMFHMLHHKTMQRDSIIEDISLLFITFCFTHKDVYTIFFTENAERVDEHSTSALTLLRNNIFDQLQQALQLSLSLQPDDAQLLSFTRIYFYMLWGLITTYQHSKETPQQLLSRLEATFKESFHLLLLGFKQKLETRNK